MRMHLATRFSGAANGHQEPLNPVLRGLRCKGWLGIDLAAAAT